MLEPSVGKSFNVKMDANLFVRAAGCVPRLLNAEPHMNLMSCGSIGSRTRLPKRSFPKDPARGACSYYRNRRCQRNRQHEK